MKATSPFKVEAGFDWEHNYKWKTAPEKKVHITPISQHLIERVLLADDRLPHSLRIQVVTGVDGVAKFEWSWEDDMETILYRQCRCHLGSFEECVLDAIDAIDAMSLDSTLDAYVKED